MIYYAVLVIAFITALLAVEALYGLWNASRGPEARRIAQRLRVMSAGGHAEEGDVSLLKKRELAKAPALERLLLQLPRVHQMDRLLQQSGMNLSVAMFLVWTAALLVVGLLIGWIATRLWVFALIAGGFAAVIPYLLVLRAKIRRMHTLLVQLPEALDLVARALRAGHALSGGIKMVADEIPEPIASEFRITFDELNYGLPLENAMFNLSERVDIPDMKYFVISVLLQRETGGNLAAILDKISKLIRDRLHLLGRVRVLAAMGRLEGWILSILPFAIVGIMLGLRPDMMSLLWLEPTGRTIGAIALAMMAAGIFVMWRMIRIRI